MYDTTFIDMCNKYLIDNDNAEEIIKYVNGHELDKEQHAHVNSVIKLMLLNKNNEIEFYGKVLSFVLYKEDIFGIAESDRYKQIIKQKDNEENNEDSTETHRPTLYIRQKCDVFYIQQAIRILKDEKIDKKEKMNIWANMEFIVKQSTYDACVRYAEEIVDLFLKDCNYVIEIEETSCYFAEKYKKALLAQKNIQNLIETNIQQNTLRLELDNLDRNQEKGKISLKKIKILDVKCVFLVKLLVSLFKKTCFKTVCNISDKIFVDDNTYAYNALRYYLIESVTF